MTLLLFKFLVINAELTIDHEIQLDFEFIFNILIGKLCPNQPYSPVEERQRKIHGRNETEAHQVFPNTTRSI